MNCHNCGQPLEIGAAFCGNCGAAVPGSQNVSQPISDISPNNGAPIGPQPPHDPLLTSNTVAEPKPVVPVSPTAVAATPAPLSQAADSSPSDSESLTPTATQQAAVANPAIPGSHSPFAGQASNKNYLTTFLLAYFLGTLGADRFYMGEIGLGILKLVTLGGCGIWAFIDTILVLAGVRKDKWGRELYGRDKEFKTSLIIFIIFIALSIAGVIAQSLSGAVSKG